MPTRARMSNHRDRHDSDWPSARNQNIFAQYWKRESRVHRVAKRIEDSSDFLIDVRFMAPDIGHRQYDELSERSRPIYTNA